VYRLVTKRAEKNELEKRHVMLFRHRYYAVGTGRRLLIT